VLVWTCTDLEDLFTQLRPPFLLTGYLNAHSRLWGCRDTNIQGKLVKDFMLKNNLCLLNTGADTCLHPGTGSTSAFALCANGRGPSAIGLKL